MQGISNRRCFEIRPARIHYHWGSDRNGIEKYKKYRENHNKKKKLTVGNDQRDN
jgi:hypothetical protein